MKNMFAIFSAKTNYAWASLVTTRLLLTLLVCLTATLFVNSAGATATKGILLILNLSTGFVTEASLVALRHSH